ncbi:MAG: hypothetical protein AOA65_1581 [Candidatus Bathyarchaeota archaeon BA1]|nr:MAG: hypothetical protein AOA65_1581 [Candidatus Bathyarchaeota archaeon BA1]
MIERLKAERYTAPKVYKEAVGVGKEQRFSDAPIVEDLIKRGIISIREPLVEPPEVYC